MYNLIILALRNWDHFKAMMNVKTIPLNLARLPCMMRTIRE